jgi:hypothetical protein
LSFMILIGDDIFFSKHIDISYLRNWARNSIFLPGRHHHTAIFETFRHDISSRWPLLSSTFSNLIKIIIFTSINSIDWIKCWLPFPEIRFISIPPE